MAEADVDISRAGPRELLLDPFAFHHGVASRIAGLGGSDSGSDPGYVFHTPYVAVAEGTAHFTVRFSHLVARRGTLVLRVHMIADEPGAHARLVNSVRIQLNRLVGMNGEAQIRLEGYHGVKFALYGSIADQTDAEAEGLMVTLDRPAEQQDSPQIAAEARESAFGREAIRPEARLVSLAPPTLAAPVCQVGTAAQLEEPVGVEWIAELGWQGSSSRLAWSRVFVLQALSTYGFLRAGANGIGFQHGGRVFARIASDRGAMITLADVPRAGALPPRDLLNFDFLWSIDATINSGSVYACNRFVEASFACLRPGGLAVHILPFDPSASLQNIAAADHACFSRGDVERLTMSLISRGHEVAQIRVGAEDALSGSTPGMKTPTAAFGLIARKAPLAR